MNGYEMILLVAGGFNPCTTYWSGLTIITTSIETTIAALPNDPPSTARRSFCVWAWALRHQIPRGKRVWKSIPYRLGRNSFHMFR